MLLGFSTVDEARLLSANVTCNLQFQDMSCSAIIKPVTENFQVFSYFKKNFFKDVPLFISLKTSPKKLANFCLLEFSTISFFTKAHGFKTWQALKA